MWWLLLIYVGVTGGTAFLIEHYVSHPYLVWITAACFGFVPAMASHMQDVGQAAEARKKALDAEIKQLKEERAANASALATRARIENERDDALKSLAALQTEHVALLKTTATMVTQVERLAVLEEKERERATWATLPQGYAPEDEGFAAAVAAVLRA